MLLGLDLGGQVGWALAGRSCGVFEYGVFCIVPKRGESPGIRYLRLQSALHAIHRRWPGLRLIAFEAAHHRGGAATAYALGAEAIVQAVAADLGIEHVSIHSATLKRFATGKGHASKAEMIAAATAATGWETLDEHAADAVHAARWASSLLWPSAA